MDILSHFRSIEELTKTLSREQQLLGEMFEKRKLLKFPQSLALELVGGNENRLRKLIDYGVLVESGNAFFEQYLTKHHLPTTALFVSCYPQSTDLRKWLISCPNHIHSTDHELQSLIDLINHYHKCYDQEGYIDKVESKK